MVIGREWSVVELWNILLPMKYKVVSFQSNLQEKWALEYTWFCVYTHTAKSDILI